MRILRPAPHASARDFDWSGKIGIAESSDLGWRAGWTSQLGRVYDDACDVGFTMHSPVTGRVVTFALVSERVEDGDLLYCDFECVTPGHKGIRARVFND
jgi:hypothetical protein